MKKEAYVVIKKNRKESKVIKEDEQLNLILPTSIPTNEKKDVVPKELTIQEQLSVFAEIIVDIYLES